MAQQRRPGLGTLELGGIGFAVGVMSGFAATCFIGGADMLVFCCGAVGLVLAPALRRLPVPRASVARPVVIGA